MALDATNSFPTSLSILALVGFWPKSRYISQLVCRIGQISTATILWTKMKRGKQNFGIEQQ